MSGLVWRNEIMLAMTAFSDRSDLAESSSGMEHGMKDPKETTWSGMADGKRLSMMM